MVMRSRPVVILLRILAVPLGLLWFVGFFALTRRAPGSPTPQLLLVMPLSQAGGALIAFLLASGLGRSAGGWAAGSLFFPMLCLPVLAFLPYSDFAYWARPAPASASTSPASTGSAPAAAHPEPKPRPEAQRSVPAEPVDLPEELYDRVMVRSLELAQQGVPRERIPELSVSQISELMMKEHGIAMPEMVRIVQQAFARHRKP
jgi:hypothetical protein